ncbi:thioester domain-containing protein [Streptomyces sp. NPDC002454]
MVTTGLLAVVVLFVPGTAVAAAEADPPQSGDTVYIENRQGYSGTGFFSVHSPVPADPDDPGEPDLWAYCIEHDVTALTDITGTVSGPEDFLGSNHFTDPAVQGKVLWVLEHGYPALSLEEFGAAAGVPGIARNDAIEAMQYAIWRYTDLDFDAAWAWETSDSEDAYYYLINGANASTGTPPTGAATSISIAAPSTAQEAGTIVGPFVVSTNRPTVRVSVTPGATLTDENGAALDPNSVVDGQALYLDLRGTDRSGTATITATAPGSAHHGRIVSVPTSPGGTPTAADHAQSIVLVAPSGATTSAEALARWSGVEDEETGGTTGSESTGGGESTGGNGGAGASGGGGATGGSDGTGGGQGSGGNGTTSSGAGGAGTTGGDDGTEPDDGTAVTTGGSTTGGAAEPSAGTGASTSPAAGGPLAATGSNGIAVTASIAGVLAAVGVGVLLAVRRRRTARR